MSWIIRCAVATIGMAICGCAAQAADISGVWVSNLSVCNKVFVTKNGKIGFSDSSDQYGSGFIIEGDQIRGKIATCKIKVRKQDGDTIHLLASCATDVMFSDNEFSLEVVNQDKITRFFPGIPELKTDYFRCKL